MRVTKRNPTVISFTLSVNLIIPLSGTTTDGICFVPVTISTLSPIKCGTSIVSVFSLNVFLIKQSTNTSEPSSAYKGLLHSIHCVITPLIVRSTTK